MEPHSTVALDVWDVLEERDDNGKEHHEADCEDQGPRQHQMAVPQALLHVKVEA